MSISKEQYSQLVKNASPPSKSHKTLPSAFVVGGFICCLGQLFCDIYTALGLKSSLCSGAASCTIVFITAMLTGLGVFDNIAKFGGAGAFVPISGFANAVASPTIEFKTEGYVLGIGAKMFVIAGPVIVYGVVASIIYGFVVWAFGLY